MNYKTTNTKWWYFKLQYTNVKSTNTIITFKNVVYVIFYI